MNDAKKKWVPVYFPQGPFKGSVNISIKGEHVVSADAAKELIDNMSDVDVKDIQANNGSCSGCAKG